MTLMQRFIDSIAPTGWQDADGFHLGARPVDAIAISLAHAAIHNSAAPAPQRKHGNYGFPIPSAHGPSQHTPAQRPEARGAVNESGDIHAEPDGSIRSNDHA